MALSSVTIDSYQLLIEKLVKGRSSAIAEGKQTPLIVDHECAGQSPLDWLRSTSLYPRVYWSGRDGELEIAGCGSTLMFGTNAPGSYHSRLEEVETLVESASSELPLYLLGGLRFDSHATPDRLWSAFPGLWFFLPRVVVVRTGRQTRLIAYARSARADDIDEAVEQVALLQNDRETDRLETPSCDSPTIVSRNDLPGFEEWKSGVNDAIGLISSGQLDKAVLARRSDLHFRSSLPAIDLLERVRSTNPNCYGIVIQTDPETSFVSGTPERLFRLTGRQVETEAVAGTVLKTAAGTMDRENPELLLRSSKNKIEQQYVVDGVIGYLERICESVESSSMPDVLELANVLHLRSQITGDLKSDFGFPDLLAAIHPTPAVCGLPREEALKIIKSCEPFDRGWYAGPIGYITKGQSEFAVAIRSALIRNRELSLFAGAGIVAGSEAEAEWHELDHKLTTILQVLTGVPA